MLGVALVDHWAAVLRYDWHEVTDPLFLVHLHVLFHS